MPNSESEIEKEILPEKRRKVDKRCISLVLIALVLFAASAVMTGLYIHAKSLKTSAKEIVLEERMNTNTVEQNKQKLEQSKIGSQPNRAQAIVVSFPGKNERSYYKKSLKDIVAFFYELDNKTAIGKDNLYIIHDDTAKELDSYDFKHAKFIEVKTGNDLWNRDFFTAVPDTPVKFVYRPDYLPKSVSKATDKLAKKFIIKRLGCEDDVTWSDLIVDGGNVVENGKDKAVISRRVFRDNPELSQEEVVSKLEKVLGRKVALVPDPEDKTGHSDGFVSFIEEDCLLLGDFGEDEFYEEVKTDILSVFPDLKIVALPSYEVKKEFDGFASAEGMYANALVTFNNIYVPMFKRENANEVALKVFEENTEKKVLDVDTSMLAYMGGNVRCMTWQVDSDHPIAKAMQDLADEQEQ